ncbi:MAG: hypothetical protein NZO16_02750 [Deltaproteobacteria bacterium]|nr:hypothetical protein [Deltaproteobacteria bacterium]
MLDPISQERETKPHSLASEKLVHALVSDFLTNAVCGVEIEFPAILSESAPPIYSNFGIYLRLALTERFNYQGRPLRRSSDELDDSWNELGEFQFLSDSGELSTHESYPYGLPPLMQLLKAELNLSTNNVSDQTDHYGNNSSIQANDFLLPFVGIGHYTDYHEQQTLGYHENYSFNKFKLSKLSPNQLYLLTLFLITATVFSPLIPQVIRGRITLVSSSKAQVLGDVISPYRATAGSHFYVLKDTSNKISYECKRVDSLHINIYIPDLSPLSQFCKIILIGLGVALSLNSEGSTLLDELTKEIYDKTGIKLSNGSEIARFFNDLTTHWPVYVLFGQKSPSVEAVEIILESALQYLDPETVEKALFARCVEELLMGSRFDQGYLTDSFLIAQVYKKVARESRKRIELWQDSSNDSAACVILDRDLYEHIFARYLELSSYPFQLFLLEWLQQPNLSPLSPKLTEQLFNEYMSYARSLRFDLETILTRDVTDYYTRKAQERVDRIRSNLPFERW